VLASLKPESFHVAPEVAAPATGGGSTATVASPPSTPKGSETNEQRVRRLNQEQFDKIRAHQEKAMRCMNRAQHASGTLNTSDPAYKKVYDPCMQEN